MPLIDIEPGSGARASAFVFSQLEWRARVGESALVAIEAMLETTSSDMAAVRCQLRVAKDNLAAALSGVDVRDPRTIAGVAALVTLGLKTTDQGALMLQPRG